MECPRCGVEIPDTTYATMLRDHFAELAMPVVAQYYSPELRGFAREVWRVTDAMLAEREKEREE